MKGKWIWAVLVLIAGIVVLSGCVQQSTPETKYVCPDGSVVLNASLCHQRVTTTETPSVTLVANNTTTPTPKSLAPSESQASESEYVNEEYGFAITPPKNWTVMEDYMNGIIMFKGSVVSSSYPYMAVWRGDNMGFYNFKEYVTYWKSYKALGFSIFNESDTTVNNRAAYVLEFGTFSRSIPAGTTEPYQKKFKAILMMNDKGEVYQLTYGALPHLYNSYLSRFEKSVQTFRFID